MMKLFTEKQPLLIRCGGSYEDKFAQARAVYTYMFTHPGKKLNFMGNEIGQLREWDENKSCDWFLLDYPMHDAFNHLFQDLGALYVENDAFWKDDYDPSSFEWVNADDTNHNMFSFLRKGSNKDYLVILNFSTNHYDAQQFGVVNAGTYKEVLNTQWAKYNGNYTDDHPQKCQAVRLSRNGKPYMIQCNVPSLGATVFEVEKK